MCFSAEVSFGASAVILSIGAVAIKKSSTIQQKTFCCIPLIFSIQQFAEGILWLSLSHKVSSQWSSIATYVFLVFAQVVWPTFVPLAMILLEKEKRRKKILKVLLGLGVIVSSYLLYCLLFYKVEASISCSHIKYDVDFPIHVKNLGILYFIATVFSPIISSIKKLRLFGCVLFLSYLVTRIFYEYYLISVWCFFAAIISGVALSVIIDLNKQAKPAQSIA